MKTKNFMNGIEKKVILGIGMAILVFFASCDNDPVESPTTAIDEATLEAESIAQADFEEVDDITSNLMGVAESSSSGRVANMDDERCQCAAITHDKENKTITSVYALWFFRDRRTDCWFFML